MTAPRDPEEATAAGAPAVAEVPADTRMGAVHLGVADLQRSLDYYAWAFGLSVAWREEGVAALGADGGEELLVLFAQPGARHVRRATGLYHFALLVPERADLARWLVHAARAQVPLTGMSDHYVSEAIYLDDPDGHGIEVYWDRPRGVWEGQVAARMTTLPLDTNDLVAVLADPRVDTFEGLPAGTTMGHVHLKVAEVAPTIAFYRDVLGFGLMASLGSRAAFLSAGGYHHHIGSNTWESAGAAPPTADAAALRRMTVVLPDAAARDALAGRAADAGVEPEPLEDGAAGLRDPSGNPLALVAA